MAFVKQLLIGCVKDYGNKDAKDRLNQAWQTAMFKVAQSGKIYANELGFIGDSVADTIHHGGIEKAIFANSWQNYPAWEKFLGLQNLPFGAMGENLTIDGLDESNICIGDVHKIGSLILQVSQPRKPCFKLSKRWSNIDMAREIFRTGRSGWYYRVLQNGHCMVGDEVEILSKDELNISVMDVNMLFFDPASHYYLLDRFAKLDKITSGWHDTIKARINDTAVLKFMDEI